MLYRLLTLINKPCNVKGFLVICILACRYEGSCHRIYSSRKNWHKYVIDTNKAIVNLEYRFAVVSSTIENSCLIYAVPSDNRISHLVGAAYSSKHCMLCYVVSSCLIGRPLPNPETYSLIKI